MSAGHVSLPHGQTTRADDEQRNMSLCLRRYCQNERHGMARRVTRKAAAAPCDCRPAAGLYMRVSGRYIDLS